MSQPIPPTQYPQGPYPGTPAEPAPKRSWFARHKILTTLGVLVALIIVASAASGGGAKDAPTAAAGSAPASAAAEAPAAAAEAPAPAAGIGTPVRDGKFEFTVTAIQPGVASVGSDGFGQTAQGQFVLVQVTVQNIGDEAQYFDGSSQKAFDAQGREFSADTGAAIYLTDSNSFLNEINPGNTVNGTVVFDMPLDAAIAKLELHDSAFSGGVTVAP